MPNVTADDFGVEGQPIKKRKTNKGAIMAKVSLPDESTKPKKKPKIDPKTGEPINEAELIKSETYQKQIRGENNEGMPYVFVRECLETGKKPKTLAIEKLHEIDSVNSLMPYIKRFRLWQRDNLNRLLGTSKGKNFVIATPEQIVGNLRTKKIDERVLNEEIYGSVVLFGDLDDIDPTIHINVHADRIIKDLMNVCGKANLDVNPNTDILLSFSRGMVGNKLKLGCHFLIRKHNYFFSDIGHQMLFWEEHKNGMEYENFLDMQVYHSNRGYRTLYSDKYGQNRHLKPYDTKKRKCLTIDLVKPHIFLDHLVTNVAGDHPLLSEKYKNIDIVEFDGFVDEEDDMEDELPQPIQQENEQIPLEIFDDVDTTETKFELVTTDIEPEDEIEFLNRTLGQLVKFNFGNVVEKIHCASKNCYVARINGGLCPVSRINHDDPLDNVKKTSFVITKQSNTILKIRGKCFKGSCNQHNSRHHTKFEYVYKLKGNYIFRKNMVTGVESPVLNQEDIVALRDLVQRLFPDSVRTKFPHDLLGEFKKHGYFGMKYEPYKSKYVKPFSFSDLLRTIGIKAQCGTGKSTVSVQCLDEHGFKRILILSTRQTLSITIKQKFDKHAKEKAESEVCTQKSIIKVIDPDDKTMEPLFIHCDHETVKHVSSIVNYMELEKDDLCEYDGIIISPDSCIRLMRTDVFRSYDCVWFDEIESGLEYIAMSETLNGKRNDVWKTVRKLIKSAKYFLFTDANLSDTTLRVISMLRDVKTTVIYHNLKTRNKKRYITVRSMERGEAKLIESIKRGYRLCVACDTQIQARYINELLEKLKVSGDLPENIKILYYDGKSSQKKKKKIANCDEKWSKYDVVIYTPVIVYGVDYNGKPFDYVYGFFSGYTVNARAAYQMLERARELTQNKVFVCSPSYLFTKDPRVTSMTLNEVTIAMNIMVKDLSKLMKEYSDMFRGLNNETKDMMDPDYYSCIDSNENMYWTVNLKDPFTIMMRDFIHKNQQSKSNFMEWLKAYISESGGRIESEDLFDAIDSDVRNRTESICSSKKTIIEEIENAWAVNLSRAQLLSWEEYQNLKKRKQYLNTDEKIQMEKYQIARVYGITEPTTQFIRERGKVAEQKKFNRFVLFARSPEILNGRRCRLVLDGTEHICTMSMNDVKMVEEIYGLMELLDIEVGKEFVVMTKITMTAKMMEYVKQKREVWKELFGLNWRAGKTNTVNNLAEFLFRMMNKSMPQLIRNYQPEGKPKSRNVDGKQALLKYYNWFDLDENIKLLLKKMEFTGCQYTLQSWLNLTKFNSHCSYRKKQ
jgi:hypothetical protein